jgi:ubiquinone/menaquinone biosynthesis C-methylase UbiE
MFAKFRHRSYELENIDKGTYTPEEYEAFLIGLRRVNRWLGDVNVLQQSLLSEIERAGLKSFSVLDIGAGCGELLRVTAKWARETNREASLVGLELNERSAQAILDESGKFPEIYSVQGNGLTAPFPNRSIDYVMSSLTLHHFDDVGVVRILREMGRVAKRGVFVIDLHRTPVAYFFFITIGRIILRNRMLREDGALSILRSFKPQELRALGRQAQLSCVAVEECFPSRLVLSAKPAPIQP